MARSTIKQKSATKALRRRRKLPAKARPSSKAARRANTGRAGANTEALAIFAHDIRTTLTGILALGELLASSNLDERERRWASGIKASAEHLAALTTLIIDAAKAGTGSLTLQQNAFRPRLLIDILIETLRARAQNKALLVETAVAGDLPDAVIGDSVRLRAALENLIDNAVKFTEQGIVRLDVQAKPVRARRVQLVFSVIDSGIGLTRAEIKRLFRPFSQGSAEIARRYGGAGLGLSIVKMLAKLMSGDLTVTSAPGRGSRFTFTVVLPIAGTETEAVAPMQTPALRGLKILCTEDNPYGRVILNTILTELGHCADFVGSGEEAVGALERGYDVVLMDVMLSGIDGLEATRRIRALPGAAAATPIIGVSGRTEPGDEEAARAAGMNAYLRKPLSPSTLSKAIAAVLRHSTARQARTRNPQSGVHGNDSE
jgi:CheY-like chemotaxis protein/nitrogen-specific signal transduction histidine kinase